MIASILWDVDPVWFKVGSWEVRWYGLMWGLGFILAYEMVGRLFKKEKYPEYSPYRLRKMPPAYRSGDDRNFLQSPLQLPHKYRYPKDIYE